MGTKLKPGLYDCLAKAEPDEPLFTLLGRDILAPVVVRLWAGYAEAAGDDPAKIAEAHRLAQDMVDFRYERERQKKYAACLAGGGHNKQLDPGANPTRGYRPAHCSKCGFDMSEDSSD